MAENSASSRADREYVRDDIGRFSETGGGGGAQAKREAVKNVVQKQDTREKAALKKYASQKKKLTPEEKAAKKAKAIKEFREALDSGRVKLAEGVTADEHIKIAEDFLKKHEQTLQPSLDRLKQTMPEGVKIEGRTKEIDSALGKLERKPKYQRADRLQDATGMRVIAKNADELGKAVEALKNNYKVVETDDYTSNPQGGDGPDGLGYRSFHAIIEEDGLQKEVQLRTENQDTHAKWCHDVYKPRTPEQAAAIKSDRTSIYQYARDTGKHLATLDAGGESEPPPCPDIVQEHFGCI